MNIFLSYGHDEYDKFAHRLKRGILNRMDSRFGWILMESEVLPIGKKL